MVSIDILSIIFIVAIIMFLAIFFFIFYYSTRKPVTAKEKKIYEQTSDNLIKEINDESDINKKLSMLLEHVIYFKEWYPCFIFTIDAEKVYYLQGALDLTGLDCEVTSNDNIAPNAALNQQQMDQIVAIGWEKHDNYCREWSLEDEYDIDKIVETCIETLKIYGISDESKIEVETFI